MIIVLSGLMYENPSTNVQQLVVMVQDEMISDLLEIYHECLRRLS